MGATHDTNEATTLQTLMADDQHVSSPRGDSEASRKNFPGSSSAETSSRKHMKCLKRAEKSCSSGYLLLFSYR